MPWKSMRTLEALKDVPRQAELQVKDNSTPKNPNVSNFALRDLSLIQVTVTVCKA